MDRGGTFAVDDWVHLTAANWRHLGRVTGVDDRYNRVIVRWHPRRGWREDRYHPKYLEHYTPTDREVAEWIAWELER